MAFPKYFEVDRYALQYFKGCHNRVRDGKSLSIQWERSRSGYLEFCQEIGAIPHGMKKPSVGRIDHSTGYVSGNIRWEEYSVNSVKRQGTKYQGSQATEIDFRVLSFRKGTKEHLEHQRLASRKRWSDPNEKKRMSDRMKGNNHAVGNRGNNKRNGV